MVQVAGSKSYTNRALILAALTKGTVTLENPLHSDDTEAMVDCLRKLAIEIESHPNRMIVRGDISAVEEKNYSLFVRDSGTTARFMLALSCITPGIQRIEGNRRLSERPIRDLVDALRALGARIDYCHQEGQLPVEISSSTLSGSSVRLNPESSSQFCSALLMIAPLLPHGLTIELTGAPISKPYIEMTIDCMRDWGVRVEGSYFVPPNQRYRKERYSIEGDFSSAGYLFAAALLAGSTVTVENLNPLSAQADRRFLAILEGMGNPVSYGENRVSIEGRALFPIEVDMEECPDQVMTMAVLAAFAEGVTRISGVRSLRVKESERVVALKNELGKMGIATEDSEDCLTIYGGSPKGATIDTYNDHRIAMAFAIAGLRLPGMVIRNPEVVAKTFPTFWETLEELR